MNQPFALQVPVLDRGYVGYIEHWGSDIRIIESARMSTDKGFLGWEPEFKYVCPQCKYSLTVASKITAGAACPNLSCGKQLELDKKGSHPGDKKLLDYLYSHRHMTPFEMCGLTLEIKAPIFVFREWHRHRTQSYNEMSARYTPLPDENYRPTVERCIVVPDQKNRQATGTSGKVPTHEEVLTWLTELDGAYKGCQYVYERGLEIGIPKELARLPVPVARYSKMRASANLRNWLAFLTLRKDPAAQLEIREFAHVVGSYIANVFPHTWELFASHSSF